MAPALTEPLSPNNTLSASTSSASPRPSIQNHQAIIAAPTTSTTNNLLKTLNNNNQQNRHITHQQQQQIKPTTVVNGSISSKQQHSNLSGNVNKIQNKIGNFNTNYNKNINHNNNNCKNTNLSFHYRQSSNSPCAFQSAFEESIKKAGISLPSSTGGTKPKTSIISGVQSIRNNSNCYDQQQQQLKNKNKSKPIVVNSVIIKSATKLSDFLQRDSVKKSIQLSNNSKHTASIVSSFKENFSKNFDKVIVKTEPGNNSLNHHHHQQNQLLISSTSSSIINNKNQLSKVYQNSNNPSSQPKILVSNGPSSLLSTSSIVCSNNTESTIEAKSASATTNQSTENKTRKFSSTLSSETVSSLKKLMSPMTDRIQFSKDSLEFLELSESEKSLLKETVVTAEITSASPPSPSSTTESSLALVSTTTTATSVGEQQNSQQQQKNNFSFTGDFTPIDKDFEEAINKTLRINCNINSSSNNSCSTTNSSHNESSKEQQQEIKNSNLSKKEERNLLKLQELQQMDLATNRSCSVSNSNTIQEIDNNFIIRTKVDDSSGNNNSNDNDENKLFYTVKSGGGVSEENVFQIHSTTTNITTSATNSPSYSYKKSGVTPNTTSILTDVCEIDVDCRVESGGNTGVIGVRDDCESDGGIVIIRDDGGSGYIINQQQPDLEFSQQEIRSTDTTDTTVSASEGENNFLEDTFQDSTQPQCESQQLPQHSPNRLSTTQRIYQLSPKPPLSTTSSQHLSQLLGTPGSSMILPQNIGVNSTGGGNGSQKDFKDSEIDDQVLNDMDLLQVLKGLDSTTGGDNLCDLAGNLGLFNDVDVMNYDEIAIPNTKESDSSIQDIRNSIEKCHQQLERKCEYLLRRLRKLQTRSMAKHTSEEITGLFEWTSRLARRKDQSEHIPTLKYDEDKHRPVSVTTMRTFLRKIDTVAKTQHTNLTTDAATVKKYKYNNSSARLQGDGQHKKGSNSGSAISAAATKENVIKSFDKKTTEEIKHVAGLLHSELRHIQSTYDSDATASSSGGESADEMIPYNNQIQQSMSISKRACWRWSRERAAIASRWTWLCTQIADLEYRIRQYNDLYQQIRKNKGSVQFETVQSGSKNDKESSPTILPIIRNETAESTNLSEPVTDNNSIDVVTVTEGGTVTPNNVNGYRNEFSSNITSAITSPSKRLSGTLTGKNMNDADDDCYDDGVDDEDDDDTSMVASRTRSFQRSGFRKRKLIQTANVQTISKKIAKPSTKRRLNSSTVKCGCQWPFYPCAMCNGRPDPTAPRDIPDTMMPSERIALLDSGYHPVLSFSEDVPTSIHLEAILNMSEWQNKLIRSVSRSSKTLGRKADDHSIASSGKSGTHNNEHTKRPYCKTGLTKSKKNSLNASGISSIGISGLGSSTTSNKIKKSKKNRDYPSGYSHHSGIVQSHRNSLSSSLKSNNKLRKISSGEGKISGGGSSSINTLCSSSNAGVSSFGGINQINSTKSTNNVTTTAVSSALISSPSNSNSSNSSFKRNSFNGFQNAFAESLSNNVQCDNLDGSSNGVLPRSKNTSPTPNSNGNNSRNERSLERRNNRSSYDIDNIIIPYSVAATTRVEILQYKEIPTPKWRVIDEDNLSDEDIQYIFKEPDLQNLNFPQINASFSKSESILTPKMNKNNEISDCSNDQILAATTSSELLLRNHNSEPNEIVKSSDGKDDTVVIDNSNHDKDTSNILQPVQNDFNEDISTEAIQSRHERALLEERKKFSTFLKFPWSTRSRANRRIDSRTESSGANTPDPTSPALLQSTSVGGDQESIPSPAGPVTSITATNNCDSNDSENLSNGLKRERKRTISSRKDRDSSGINTYFETPDQGEIIPPYEPLQFPLPDDLFNKMLQEMPDMNYDLNIDDNSNVIDNDSSIVTRTTTNNRILNCKSSSSLPINDVFRNVKFNRSSSANNRMSNLSFRDGNSRITQRKNSISSEKCYSNFVNEEYFSEDNDAIQRDITLRAALGGEGSDTDSAESGGDDPNDPEWK